MTSGQDFHTWYGDILPEGATPLFSYRAVAFLDATGALRDQCRTEAYIDLSDLPGEETNEEKLRLLTYTYDKEAERIFLQRQKPSN